jgi:2-keto-3-deoxy-galactonokinase
MKPGPIAPGWGTSSLRCFLVDAAGAMLEQRGSPHGVAPLRNLALGTHSKGAGVEDGRIARFATNMTGTLFALLCRPSLLGRLMPQDNAAPGPRSRQSAPAGLFHFAIAAGPTTPAREYA